VNVLHKLQRGAAPECLANFRHGIDAWSDVTAEEKTEIWRNLESMQGLRCAYCEAHIERGKRHIEHFRQRGRFAEGTFDWTNLFGSCDHEKCCGKHKDRCGMYDPADIVKPDEEDPDDFFVFVSDGTIDVRRGLSARDEHRARETLRVLNLDAHGGRLRQMRRSAIAGHLHTVDEIRELAENLPPELWMPELQRELHSIAELPFVTAIRHALQP
jgi:uncharacterized protein (TIGR02646 family)